MKGKKISFGKVFWPSFVAVLVGSIIGGLLFLMVVGGIASAVTPKPSSVKVLPNSVLHIKLDGVIGEKTKSDVDYFSLKLKTNLGLSDLLYGLEKAKTDNAIKGVFLELGSLSCGYTTAKEIRNAINDFEKSGKFVVAYTAGELVGLGKYYISSAANELYGFPTSTMEFLGLGGELTFYKNTLDKLGIDVQIIRGKNNDFKSAVEPFFLDKMSDSSRLQMETYLNNIWTEMRNDIAKDRKVTANDMNVYAENMLIRRIKDAVQYKLIDGSKYRDEVLDIIKKKLKLSSDQTLKLVEFEKYAKTSFKRDQMLMKDNQPNVAVIIAAGDISVEGDGLTSKEVCQLLKDARANKSIKTVVLRVNSPGGSALASDEIWREVKLTNKEKKVIVSMGDVAASGGYYISTAASRIFAEPTTVTGSIGVFGMIPYFGNFMQDKLGFSYDYVRTNQHAGFTLNRKMTPEELSNVQEEVDEIYQDFLERVAEGRNMTVEQANVIARGRVWTGSDAVKIGLVDELGGLKDAIAYAAKTAGIKEPKVLYYPLVKEDMFETILEQLDEKSKNSTVSTRAAIPTELVNQYQKLTKLEGMFGIQMRMPFVMDLQLK
ncbi:MAG: signal peptide peptidase SppA [Crocinitomicaceae bacterium]|nr:signal peptide peptidase SppA [Crocinitomicaceae bacterium]